MTLVLLIGCAQKIPPMPKVETSTPTVRICSQGCQSDYTACMALDIRPDYLLFSPRKQACQKMLEECYRSCEDK